MPTHFPQDRREILFSAAYLFLGTTKYYLIGIEGEPQTLIALATFAITHAALQKPAPASYFQAR
ncbi:hypothetical protein H924_10440 [Corynebacterium callunae DSM 20147]|uniref:Uncharacterized protein n=1 Tax=Corynebacterium callunae DSM 20147 TaxID=1121353 RepID=M1TTJ3_9CORY|nr:hypothetical protein H924_10440 [Corynebacterium callunae DSM 20147]